MSRSSAERRPRGLIRLEHAPPQRLARLGLGLRSAVRSATDRLLPAEVVAYENSISFFRTRVAGALVELGVFDAIADGARTADDLARELGLDRGHLHRTLRLAATHGLLRTRRGERFSLTPVGHAMRADVSPTLAPWTAYLNAESTQRAWAALPEAIRTGEPAFPFVHGRSVWDHFADHPEEERGFAMAMRELSLLTIPFIVGGYDWPENGIVADVAGGSGPVLAAILGERPGLRGVVVEAAGVLPAADEFLKEAGVRDRVALVEGDMFERVDAPADLYLLKDVMHDYDDERCLAILRTIAAGMPAGAKLLLIETLLEPGETDAIAASVDLHMLTQCDGGRQRSAAELQALLSQAGLRPGAVHRTGGPGLVEGLK